MPLGAVVANFLNNYTEPAAVVTPRRQDSNMADTAQESALTVTRQEGGPI